MLNEDLLYLLLPGFIHGETVEFHEYRDGCPVRVLSDIRWKSRASSPPRCCALT